MKKYTSLAAALFATAALPVYAQTANMATPTDAATTSSQESSVNQRRDAYRDQQLGLPAGTSHTTSINDSRDAYRDKQLGLPADTSHSASVNESRDKYRETSGEVAPGSVNARRDAYRDQQDSQAAAQGTR